VEVTLQLSRPAPPEGLQVRLASTDPALLAPEAEVTVPAGETSLTFLVTPKETTRSDRLSYLATLTASVEEMAAAATLTVAPE